jgi:hypothetical protein
MSVLLPLLLCIPALTLNGGQADESYLVKIDLPTRDHLYRLVELDTPVLEDRGIYAFAEANNIQLELIGKAGFTYEIVDESPSERYYYLVHLIHHKDPAPLNAFGEVLHFDGETALLRTPEAEPEGLFSGRWELKRLGETALTIKHPNEWHHSRTFTKDPMVEEILAAVSQDSVTAHIQRLQDFVTRYSYTDSCISASNWLHDKFLSFGIDSVYKHHFASSYADNVIATMPGAISPELIYIICGHYDSISEDPWNDAPGADDNGSGTAAVIEAARVMSGYVFDATVKFIAFAGEEQGLVGSEYYAAMAREQGDSIIGVLNFDMIGYGGYSLEMRSVGNEPSEWLVDFMIACRDTYVVEQRVQKVITSGGSWSDHASFWDEGYDALCGIETEATPFYHTTGDRIETLNLAFATNCSRVGIATLASLALPFIPTEPCITLRTHGIDDSGANNNGRADPGETVDMVTTLKNRGIEATNVEAVLREDDPYITLIDSLSAFGDMAQGDTVNNACDPYTFSADLETPLGHIATVTLHITADGGYENDQSFTIKVGDITTLPSGPDSYGYYAFDNTDLGYTECPPYDWYELALPGPGTIINEISDVDNEWTMRSLPFTFTYYGMNCSSISISSNGWLCFDSTDGSYHTNYPIPHHLGPPAIVAPFWDDLRTDYHGDVYEYYDEANHRYIIEWKEITHGSSDLWESFQVILYDPTHHITGTGDGEIVVQYERVDAPDGCTVGIENHAEDDGTQYLYNGTHHQYGAPIEAGRAIKFTTDPPEELGVENGKDGLGSIVPTYQLFQNYPNPFAASTSISYSVPGAKGESGGAASRWVILSVYDAAGRLVRTLVDGEQSPGRHRATWDGKDSSGKPVANAVYFSMLRSGSFKSVVKMVVLK